MLSNNLFHNFSEPLKSTQTFVEQDDTNGILM